MQLTSFQQSVLDYSGHISLTANAGSGKTFILAKRYLKIIMENNISLNEIIAITFTEKAASELYKKIASEINNYLIADIDLEEKQKLMRLRRQLVSANISTIHSFCINLLREFSVEAGIDTNFSIIDSYNSKDLILISITNYINEQLKNDDSDFKQLFRLLGSKKRVIEELSKIINTRKISSEIIGKFENYSFEELQNYYKDLFEREYKYYFDEITKEFIQSFNRLNSAVLNKDETNNYATLVSDLLNNHYENISSFLLKVAKTGKELLTSSNTLRLVGYLKNVDYDEQDKIIVEEFLNLFKNLDCDDYDSVVMTFSKIFYRILNSAKDIIAIYEQKKKTNGFLDFDDMLLLAKKITTNDKVMEQINYRYKFIMIDEYQDTDQLQYDIIMPLLDNLKKGNLFVVGDEKQSIYKFREAEIELFDKTRSEIVESGSDKGLLSLPHTFRLSKNIALFVNHLFKNIFKNPDKKYNEVNHSELICIEKEDEGSVSFLIANEESEITEAILIAKKIISLINSNQSYDDIAILCRKRADFSELEMVFNNYNIPYKIIGGRGFYQQQFIYDLMNYINFLIFPQNDYSLVAILRSPFYMFTDTEIYIVSKEEGTSLYEKLKKLKNKNVKYKKICELLAIHLEVKNYLTISELVNKIIFDTKYLLVLGERNNSKQEIANVKKLLEITASFDSQSYKTLYDFKEYLQNSINSIEDENQADLNDLSKGSVNVLTIHQSKGLEYKNVFLFNTNASLPSEKIKSKSIVIDKHYGFLAKVSDEKNILTKLKQIPLFIIYEYKENKKNIAENKRLLYVALTRAVNNLFICATTKDEKIVKNSFLSEIINAAKINLETEFNEITDELMFLTKDFINEKRVCALNIQIQKETDICDLMEKNTSSHNNYIYQLTPFLDNIKNDIVSATKLAVISQCNYKYKLTYELGYLKLIKLLENQDEELVQYLEKKDDEIKMYDLQGVIIHKILEKNILLDDAKSFIHSELLENEKVKQYSIPKINNLIEEIYETVEKFYKSTLYSELTKEKNYLTEHEIYSYQDELYLYGIIDKIIYKDNEILIVDYKTDKITNNNIESKKEYYLTQLCFYAYIIKKQNPEKKINVKIVFIKTPDKSITFEYNDHYEKYIGTLIKNYNHIINEKKYIKNKVHCNECHLYKYKLC